MYTKNEIRNSKNKIIAIIIKINKIKITHHNIFSAIGFSVNPDNPAAFNINHFMPPNIIAKILPTDFPAIIKSSRTILFLQIARIVIPTAYKKAQRKPLNLLSK